MDQLTAVKTRYPLISITWQYRGLRCRPIEVEYLFEVIRWQVTSFQMIAGSRLFFKKFIWNMLCLCHYDPALLRVWFQTNLGREYSASYLEIQAGRAFSYHGQALVPRFTSNVYALIGQSLTGEFKRKVYAAAWNLLTLTAEADRFCVNLWCFYLSLSTGCTK